MFNQRSKNSADKVNPDVANRVSVRKSNQIDGEPAAQATPEGTTNHHATGVGAATATTKRTLPPDESAEPAIPYKTRNIVGKRFADEVSFVVFDLETGGLRYLEHDILQISAVCGDKEFNAYVEPTRPISREASNVNKLTHVNGQLHYKRNPVETIPITDALQQFMDFLQEIPKPIPVGHYSKQFDLPFLRFYLKENNMWETFLSVVVGYVDTWIVFRQEFPNRTSYKQVDLVRGLLGEEYEAHSALEDVRALQKLSKLVKEKLLKYRFGAKEIGMI